MLPDIKAIARKVGLQAMRAIRPPVLNTAPNSPLQATNEGEPIDNRMYSGPVAEP